MTISKSWQAEEPQETVANGLWCAQCEYFELTSDTEIHRGDCQACGCPAEEHHRAKVMVWVED